MILGGVGSLAYGEVKRCLALAANQCLKREGLRSLRYAGSRIRFMDCDGRVLAHLRAQAASRAARVPKGNAFHFIGL